MKNALTFALFSALISVSLVQAAVYTGVMDTQPDSS